MKLSLVRHGETEENLRRIVQGHLPGHLTANGIQQAKRVAKELAPKRFDEIWSSDLARCVATAKQISRFHLDVDMQTSTDLREYNFGNFQGRPSVELNWEAQIGEGLDRKVPGGESARDVAGRVSRFVNQLLTKNIDNALLVTHGGPMRIIRALAENEPLGIQFNTPVPNTAIWEFAMEKPFICEELVW